MDPTKRCPVCFETIDARATRCPRCAQRQPDAPGLHRDVPGRLAGGVAAALALHFNWDVTVVRVALVALSAASVGLGAWVYLLLWVTTPFEVRGKAPGQRLVEWAQRLFAPPTSDARPRPDEPGPGT
jgi:phage shock protein PspC (stress-responsive transcriptional regulator)